MRLRKNDLLYWGVEKEAEDTGLESARCCDVQSDVQGSPPSRTTMGEMGLNSGSELPWPGRAASMGGDVVGDFAV